MQEGTVNVFITVVVADENPDEMIEILNKMGYNPRQYSTGNQVRSYSVDMFEDDLIMLKLLSIPGAQMYINQADED